MANVADVNDAQFEEEVLKSDLPVLVDFWAPWCGPCKTIAPMLDDLAKSYEGKLKIVKVNVDSSRASMAKYNVKHIPNLIIFKNGEVKQQIVGAGSKQDIVTAIDNVLA
jgi:thioredoxin 1